MALAFAPRGWRHSFWENSMQLVIIMEIDEKKAELNDVTSSKFRVKRSIDGQSETREATGMNALECAALLGALNSLINDNCEVVGAQYEPKKGFQTMGGTDVAGN